MAATSIRRMCLVSAAASYALVFAAFLVWETPGLGIAHFWYVSIALLALASGPWTGAAGGVIATSLYAFGVLLNPQIPPAELVTIATPIRFTSFVTIGALVGWFASSNRSLLDELRVLADRDSLTGLPNTRAFEAAITRRLQAGRPFALLVGDVDAMASINEGNGDVAGNELLRRAADTLARSLASEDEFARIGGDEFAVLTTRHTLDEASQLAAHVERCLAGAGCAITFGWAVHPRDGDNALALYRSADERLYARKLVRGRRRGDGQSEGGSLRRIHIR
jgi:diguanylate cyclase (GGDEF)-like protein